MKLYQYLFVTTLIVETVSSFMWCTWNFQSVNSSNPWAEFGLRLTSDKCLWADKEKPQISIRLYNQLFSDFVPIQIYFDDSYFEGYSYYNRAVTITFPKCKEKSSKLTSSNCIIQSHAYLNNSKLNLTLQTGQTIAIELSQNEIQNSNKLLFKTVLYFAVNLLLAFIYLIEVSRKSLAIQLVIAHWGWLGFLLLQLKDSLFYFQPQTNIQISFYFCIFYIIDYLLLLPLVLHIQMGKIKKAQLTLWFAVLMVCQNILALALAKQITFILFTLILLVQIVHNITNGQQCQIPISFLLTYLLNITCILYILGLIPNNRGQKVDYVLGETIIALAVLQIVILILQRIIGPQLGFKSLLALLDKARVKKQIKQIKLKEIGDQELVEPYLREDMMNEKAIAVMNAAGIILQSKI